jgi:pimeloyl-ACP methyl ester carboxylesterase
VLLIMGLGLSGGAWWRTVPTLAEGFEVVTFDNRGVGRSPALMHAYTTAVMADDAVSVLDAAGIDRAHVYGISLGGMVAQQVALRHPDRVSSLVLGATTPGGRHAHPPAPVVFDFLRRRMGMPHEQAVTESVPFNYSESCRNDHPERIAEDLSQRLQNRFPAQAYMAQLVAASLHDTYPRLQEIVAPTLVVHGSDDSMIPVQNGRLLASRIRRAELRELPGAGHLYPTEMSGVDADIAAFMAAHS